MTKDIKEAVKQQFGAHAAQYVTSSVHSKGSDLPRLAELAALTGEELVLDVATAAGHTALALAPGARHVSAVDLTAEMLVEARRLAEQQGVQNVTFTQADAEQLPFPNDRFEVVTCRIAAHHFPDVPAFCREAARVLRPGGLLLVVDNIAPEDDDLDSFINSVEKLRDPSHVRAYRLSEWERFLTEAGLAFLVDRQFTTTMDLEDWMARTGVPEPVAANLRNRFAGTHDRIRETFAITEADFQLFKAIVIGRKPGGGTAEVKSRT